MWNNTNAYAGKYVKVAGNAIEIIYDFDNREETSKIAHIALKPSTRAAYAMALREASIDGAIYVDDENRDALDEMFIPSRYFIKMRGTIEEIYMIQANNNWRDIINSRDISAVKCNGIVDIKIKDLGLGWKLEYEGIYSFGSAVQRDNKQFTSGVEDGSLYQIQIPKLNLKNEMKPFEVSLGSKLIYKDIVTGIEKEYEVVSIDDMAMTGATILQAVIDVEDAE